MPARRIAIVRTLTFGYATAWLLIRAPYVWDVAGLPERRFEPVGVLAWLERMPARPVVVTAWLVAVLSTGLATRGWLLAWTAPLGATSMLFIATFTSSFGQIFHTEHLLVIQLAILAAAVLIDRQDDTGRERSGWALNAMMAATVTAYVVTGIAKLRLGGSEWLTGDGLRRWVAVDNLRKAVLDDPYSVLGGWLVGIGWIWAPIALATLVVELGAPVALRRGRLRLAWVAAAWMFHVGVLAVMAISFPYQLSGVAFVAFLDMERVERRLRRRRATDDPSAAATSTAVIP